MGVFKRFAKVAACVATVLAIPLCMQCAVSFANGVQEQAATKSSGNERVLSPRADPVKQPCPTDQTTAKRWDGVSWRITNETDGGCTLRVSGGTITGNLQNINPNVPGYIPWVGYRSSITAAVVEGNLTINPASGNYMFSVMPYLETFTAKNGFHLRGQQYSLFNKDYNLKHIYGMETWDTTGTTSMEAMFLNCKSLESVDVTHFDTSQVTSISQMFAQCETLESVDLSHFDTRNVTEMYGVFHHSGFKTLDLKSFNTANVTRMDALVNGCSQLTSIDVTSFNTAKAGNMSVMFNACPNLTVLDLSSFDTSSAYGKYSNPNYPELSYGVDRILPPGLEILKLGPSTRLSADAFAKVLNRDDWVRASSMGPKYDVLEKVGTTSDLAAVADGARREGIYRPGKLATKISLTIVWANGEANQTVSVNAGAPYTVPSLSAHRNPAGALFSKWTLDTTQYTGQLIPGGTITFNESITNPNIKLTATWQALESPTVKVVNTVAVQGQDPTVDLQSTASKSPKDNDEIRVWSTTGSPKQPAKWDQTYTYMTGNSNPFSWRAVDAGKISPAPGAPYELHTTEARVDPYTGNKVISKENVTSGKLPYTTVTYTGEGQGKTSGTPPAPSVVYTNTDFNGNPTNANITLPLLTSESAGGLKHSEGVCVGWSTKPNALNPDRGMGNPASRDYTLNAVTSGVGQNTDSDGHTTLVLNPVWRQPILPDLNGANFKVNPDGTITMDGISPEAFSPSTDTMVLDNDGVQWKPTDFRYGRWNATSSQLVDPGNHKITATVTAPDAWREGGTPSNPVKAVFKSSINKDVADNWVSNLPLTGGLPQKFAILIAAGLALALILVAAVRYLRNKRQEQAGQRNF